MVIFDGRPSCRSVEIIRDVASRELAADPLHIRYDFRLTASAFHQLRIAD